MSAGLPLTVTTNTDPFILTTSAQIVEMDVRARGPIPDAIMSLRWTMTSENYQRFVTMIGEYSRMLLTVDAGQGLVLTSDAQIVAMDLRTKTPVTVAMTLHGTMTREAYNLFLIKVMSTPRVEMDVDVNRTPDGHFDAHFKARGEQP
jgi:hypothetical protein